MEWVILIFAIIVLGACLWAWGASRVKKEKERKKRMQDRANAEADYMIACEKFGVKRRSYEKAYSWQEKKTLESEKMKAYEEMVRAHKHLVAIQGQMVAEGPDNPPLPNLPKFA